MRNLTSLAFILSGALLLSACSSTKLDTVPVEERAGSTPTTGSTNGSAANAAANTGNVGTVDATSSASNPNDPTNDPNGILARRSIYFDFDSYIVKDEFKPVIEAHAKFLSNSKGRKAVIQGNTDERGGREYNLALGQKRAEAVRKSLVLLGVPDAQLEAVSFGKEKPKATGTDEATWAENRRSDIVYP